VVHTTAEQPTVVGDDCVIGHLVHLEACTIEPWCLIGNGSMVLHRVVVHSWAIVAANAVVLNDTIVPTGALAVGTPAVIKAGRVRREQVERGVAIYIERANRFRTQLRRID
jgi:carbonic anhydrase/acetyltransferase-like protein (isoleucine patch superfamily)